MSAPINRLLDSVEWEAVPFTEEMGHDGIPYMTHKGVLSIGGIELPCAVLSNGQRIFYGELIDEMMAGVEDMKGKDR